MHPVLASVYTCALTERIATDDRLHPVTDQLLPHSALSGWTIDRLAQTLVERPLTDNNDSHHRDDLSDAFVHLAFETVIPADIERVPVEKIVELRTRFGAELDAFRGYVTEQTRQMAELQDVRDLSVFQEYLRSEVQHNVTNHLTQLRERLRSVGLDSATALINVKSVALPGLADVMAHAIGLPPTVTDPAALAWCVLKAPFQWRRQRRTAIRESPVGYLFRIEQALNPPTLIDRLIRSWAAR